MARFLLGIDLPDQRQLRADIRRRARIAAVVHFVPFASRFDIFIGNAVRREIKRLAAEAVLLTTWPRVQHAPVTAYARQVRREDRLEKSVVAACAGLEQLAAARRE